MSKFGKFNLIGSGVTMLVMLIVLGFTPKDVNPWWLIAGIIGCLVCFLVNLCPFC